MQEVALLTIRTEPLLPFTQLKMVAASAGEAPKSKLAGSVEARPDPNIIAAPMRRFGGV